jgi:hypothetical protein
LPLKSLTIQFLTSAFTFSSAIIKDFIMGSVSSSGGSSPSAPPAKPPDPKKEEAKKPEPPKPDSPKETPKTEPPKSEAPKEAPKTDPPKSEAPKEAPKTDPPKSEAPKEAPKTDPPKKEEAPKPAAESSTGSSVKTGQAVSQVSQQASQMSEEKKTPFQLPNGQTAKAETAATGSGQKPATGSGQKPATGSEQKPATGSEQKPATGSEQKPATGSEQKPATGSEQKPAPMPVTDAPGSGQDPNAPTVFVVDRDFDKQDGHGKNVVDSVKAGAGDTTVNIKQVDAGKTVRDPSKDDKPEDYKPEVYEGTAEQARQEILSAEGEILKKSGDNVIEVTKQANNGDIINISSGASNNIIANNFGMKVIGDDGSAQTIQQANDIAKGIGISADERKQYINRANLVYEGLKESVGKTDAEKEKINADILQKAKDSGLDIKVANQVDDKLANYFSQGTNADFEAGKAAYNQALKDAEQKNISITLAEGNEGKLDNDKSGSSQNLLTSSTNSAAVIGVGAVDEQGRKTDFSSFGGTDSNGRDNDVSALGKAVNPIDQSGEIMQGTSFSAPRVAGQVAALRAQNPNATSEEIKAMLMAQTPPAKPEPTPEEQQQEQKKKEEEAAKNAANNGQQQPAGASA